MTTHHHKQQYAEFSRSNRFLPGTIVQNPNQSEQDFPMKEVPAILTPICSGQKKIIEIWAPLFQPILKTWEYPGGNV